MKRPCSSHPGRLAFTLLELMVVIILIGILAAAILPAMRGTFEHALLRSASRELIDVCSIAGSHAVSLNESHRVRIDRQTGRYLIERQMSEDERVADFIPVRDLPGGEGQIDARIAIQIRRPAEMEAGEAGEGAPEAVSDQTITFYSDGTADSVEIELEDRDGFRQVLRINPVTARIRILDQGRKGVP